MRLDRLRLVNFRQHADTVLSFETGLTGIVGPNGSGKTTLLEAIAWAMYGTAALRGTRDSVRRRNAPPRSRVEVELEFGLGGHRYRVIRSLQTAALYLDGDPAPIANSTGAVTEKVTRVLGMTRDEFFNTYFTGQKELAIMAAMTAPDRARFLSQVLGYERLATVQLKLREERSALRAALTTAETGLIELAALEEEERSAASRLELADRLLAMARAGVGVAERQLAERRPQWEEWERRREAVQVVETDLQISEHQAIEARRAFQELDRDLAEAITAAGKRDELLPELVAWDELVALRDRLDQEAQLFAGRRALEAQAVEVAAAVVELEGRLGRLPDQSQLIRARTSAVAAAEAVAGAKAAVEEEQARWVREKQDAATKRTSLLKQHAELKEQLERLQAVGPTVVCPTCGKPLGKEYDKVLEELEVSLVEATQEGRFYRQRLDQLAEEPPELAKLRAAAEQAEETLRADRATLVRLETEAKDRDSLTAALAAGRHRAEGLRVELAAAPASYDEAGHRRVRERLSRLEPARTELARLSAVADRAALLVPKATEAEQILSRREARVVELRERLTALGWSAESFEAARSGYQEAERSGQAAQLALVRAEAERKAAEEHRAAVARRREERDQRAREVERLKADALFNQELDRAFTDLRDELNAALRPDLAETASGLLRDLTNGRYDDLEITEDYLPAIVDDGEPKTVVSGGEEDVANLALRLAISQMIADRAGQPLSMLVLDEVFGSLDEERRNAVLDLLRRLADRFPQVILITHIESVRDGFDRVVRIDYDVERGVASAREERAPAREPSDAAA
jgi:exonuclease SbcC